MRKPFLRLLTYQRGVTSPLPTTWKMLPGRTEPQDTLTAPCGWEHWNATTAGESGPVTASDMERFRADPDLGSADPRFLGKRPGEWSEDFG